MSAQRKIFRIEETMRNMPQHGGGLAAHGGMAALDSLAAYDGMAALGDMTDSTSLRHAELMDEIQTLRHLVETGLAARPVSEPISNDPQIKEVRKLRIELDVIGDAIKQTRSEIVSLQDQGFDSSRIARVARELEAVVDGTETATDKILKSAEGIDEGITALSAIIKGAHEQGLAQDIQDRITGIFEACNFHDLTGQRISKVVTTLKLVEDHLARMMEIWSVIDRFNVEAAQAAADNLGSLINGPKLNGDSGHSSQTEIDVFFD